MEQTKRQARGDLTGAAGQLKEGLALAAEAGDEPSVAYYLEALAAVAALQDDPQGSLPVPGQGGRGGRRAAVRVSASHRW